MTNPHLLVAGAINTDLVASMSRAPRAGETITGSSFSIHGGGKGANQAVAAARSGAVVSMLGAIGDDDFGKQRQAELVAEGIDCEHVTSVSNCGSGVALIFVEAEGDNRIAYVPGSTSRISAGAVKNAFAAASPSHLLVPNELPSAALEELLRLAHAAGSHVALNAAPDPELTVPMLPFVDLLIVNQGEADALLGASNSVGRSTSDRLSALRRLGPRTVMITMGGSGVDAVHDGVNLHQPTPRVDAVDTTGAGDTFCGAFVSALMRGQAIESALEYGVFASAISVTRAGAQSSIPSRSDVEELIAEHC